MSTQEATTQAASPKKAKASKKAVMTTTARKAKNAAEAHKANGSRSGSKAGQAAADDGDSRRLCPGLRHYVRRCRNPLQRMMSFSRTGSRTFSPHTLNCLDPIFSKSL